MNISLRIATVLLVACSAIGAFALHVIAQEPASEVSALQLEAISIENLPAVSLFVKGENMEGALPEVTLRVREDGIDQELLGRNVIENGLQIALAVDPALDLASVGNSGDAFQFEIANGASSLIQSGILSVRTDLLNAFATADEAAVFGSLITEWQRDHQAVVNRLYQYTPGVADSPVSLVEGLDNIIAAMQGDAQEGEFQRTIILFSDALSPLSNLDANQIIGQAQAQDISINVVLLGDVNSESRRNLIGIAESTDGNTVTYESASSLNKIWRQIDESSQIEELIYRLGKAEPRQISVSALAADGGEIEVTQDFPEVALEPVEIEVLLADQTGIVERSSDDPDSLIEDFQPSSLPVIVKFSWPDGVERKIKEVVYSIRDVVSVQEVGPFDSYELPITDLDEGLYSVDVAATDEYGLSSPVKSIPINVIVNRPSTTAVLGAEAESNGASNSANMLSTETTQSELVQEDASNQGMNILGLQLPETIDIFGVTFLVNGITLLIALFPIIFLLALFLYWLTQRNEQPAEPDYGYYEYDNNGYFYRFESSADDNLQMTQPQVSVIEPEEELTMPVKLPSFYTNAAAYLVYVSGGEHLPKKIAIETNEPVRIGRKKSFCDQILDDQRVSRLHAVITYEGGHFFVKDEGSSGGTFVNRRKLGPTDKQLLKSSDIINFNEVEYRMEVTEPDSIADSADTPEVIQELTDPESVVS